MAIITLIFGGGREMLEGGAGGARLERAGFHWLTSVILATQEAEIRRMAI
jgi:hypothetical protein